jgi:hypothetical protein
MGHASYHISMRAKKTIRLLILGHKWKVRMWSGFQYDKYIDGSSLAMCDVENKTMDFDLDEITEETCRHELVTHSLAR